MPEAVIVAIARSSIGRAYKGSLRDVRPDDLAVQMVNAVLAKTPQLDPRDIEGLVLGSAQPGGEAGYNMARVLHHRRLPGQQLVPDRRQQAVPAGEPRVAGRDVPHPQHAVRRQRTRVLPGGGQFPQGAFYQPAQLIGTGERLRHQAAGLHPVAERLLPGPERQIDQLRQRDAHVSGGGV